MYSVLGLTYSLFCRFLHWNQIECKLTINAVGVKLVMWYMTFCIKSGEGTAELDPHFRNKCSKMLHQGKAANFMLKKEALFSSPAVAVLVGSASLLEKNPGRNLHSLSS